MIILYSCNVISRDIDDMDKIRFGRTQVPLKIIGGKVLLSNNIHKIIENNG